MARVIVTGGGMVGLCTAMLLGRDGHEITVLERDPAEPPDDVEAIWWDWERRGVNQFRLLHFLLPRFANILKTELREVALELDAAGALRINNVALAPDEITGGWRAGDETFEAITARRPVAEAAVARVAARTRNVTIRRGCAVTGLI